MKNVILSCLIVLLGFLNQASAAFWYVSPSGSDNNSGTLVSPFQTIDRAIDAADPGDVIELRGGNYHSEEIRITKNNLTIRSYPGEWAVITASLDIEDIASCIWYSEPDIEGGTLENLEIIGGYYYGVSFETNWDWGVSPKHGASNITIRNCKIHDTGRDCIKIKPACNNIKILNCELYNSGIGPSNSPQNGGPNAEGIDNVNGDGMIVRNTYIHHTSTSGVYAKGGASDCIIEENLVMNTGEAGILLGFYTDAEFFDNDGSNPAYYECNNSISRNNIVINTGGAGIGLFAARNCAAYHNTVVTASTSYHAPLYFSPGEVWIDDNTTLTPANYNVQVFNNIFIDKSGTGEEDFTAQIREGGLSGTNMINNNIYHKLAGPALFDDGVSWPALNFATWKSNLSIDGQSMETNPGIDANIHLTSNSAALDKGLNSQAITDYDGKPRSGSPDIGADEYNNGAALVIPPPANIIGTGATGSPLNKQNTQDIIYKIYPNPTSDLIKIETEGAVISSVKIISLDGKILLNSNKDQLNISKIPNGIYSVVMDINGQINTQKITVINSN